MKIDDFVHDALNTLKDIATNEAVDIESRINAAEKILDYAARNGEDQGSKVDAIGFAVGDNLNSDGQDFGDYFRGLRRAAGFKYQKTLAEKSGISQAAISRIEDGTQVPRKDTLAILANCLGVPDSLLIDKAGYQSDTA